MRILILSQWFSPEPDFKGLPFAKAIRDRGHDVEVLTGFPNYPGGKLYPGYRIKLWQREVMDGISVLRAPLYPSHDRSVVGRILNYGTFASSASVLGTFLTAAPDLIYAYHAPATIGLPAVVLSWTKNARIVYDINDLWPDTIAATGMLDHPLTFKMIDTWCNFVYRAVDHIVVVTDGFRQKLIERGVPNRKVSVIYNWSNESTIKKCPSDQQLAEQLGLGKSFNFLFAGTMGAAQDIDTVLRAAGLLKESLPAVQFVFVGGGTETARLKEQAAAQGLTNVRFLPHQPADSIGRIMALADVLMVHLRDHPLFRITVPSKTQVYMAMGKPILMAMKGDAAELVRTAGAGLVCEPGNPQEIANLARIFYEMPAEQRRAMGESGGDYYRRELSMERGVDRFVQIFEGLCRRQDVART